MTPEPHQFFLDTLQRYERPLIRYAQNIVGQLDDARDIVQDVFVKLQSHLDEFHDPAKIQGWLFLVARNAIIDHYRTRKKTTEMPESLPAEPPENDLEVEELKAAFRRIIYSLPEPYRDSLVLTEFKGLTQDEAGEAVGHLAFGSEIARATRAGVVEGAVARRLPPRVPSLRRLSTMPQRVVANRARNQSDGKADARKSREEIEEVTGCRRERAYELLY